MEASVALRHLDPPSVLRPRRLQPALHQPHQPRRHSWSFAPAAPITDKAHRAPPPSLPQTSLLIEAFPGPAGSPTPCPAPTSFWLQPPSLSNILHVSPVLSSSATRMKALGVLAPLTHHRIPRAQGDAWHIAGAYASEDAPPPHSLPSAYLWAIGLRPQIWPGPVTCFGQQNGWKPLFVTSGCSLKRPCGI